MKRNFTTLLALLLMLCTVLSLCGIFSACKKEPADVDSGPSSPEPIVQNNCSHAVTALKNVRATSCARAGYTGDSICTACGAVVKKGETIPALAHTMDSGVQTKAPTCIVPGTMTYTCAECGKTDKSPIPCVAHQEAYHDAEDGNTHAHTCATCTLNDYEDHEPKGEGVYHNGTCTEPAYTEYTCKLCEGIYRVWEGNETVVGHKWPKDAQNQEVWQVTEPTCSATGLKSRQCQTCGHKETMTLQIAENAHNYVETNRTNATCQKAGKIYYQCQNANCSKPNATKSIPINPSAHKLEESGNKQVCKNIGCTYEVVTYVVPQGETKATVSAAEISNQLAFEVKTEEASVQFPTEVIDQIKSGNTGNVDINAGIAQNKSQILADASNLDEATRERLENVDIYNFSVSGVSGNFDKPVVVTIPYTLGDDEDPNGIKVWYVAETGEVDAFDAVFVPNASGSKEGYVTFEAKHFSYYAVAYEETQESKCRRGVHRWKPTDEDDVVAPTCTQYGYTIKECDTCHAISYDNLTDKVGHNYGDFVYPAVTCTEGGYVTKVCQNHGCGHILNFEYKRALGHQISGAATCTEDAVCTRCTNVITPASGHRWSEWYTVFEPTAVKNGLRRKNCPKCGEIEDAKLAATGAIEAVTFESYEDLMESMMESVIAFHNGIVTFECEIESGESLSMTLTINEEGESYVMLVDAVMEGIGHRWNNATNQNETYQYSDYVQFLYRNGVTVLMDKSVSPYSDGKWSADASNDLETLFMLPFEVMLNYAKQGFDLYMPSVEGSFEGISAALRIFDKLSGDSINGVLKEIGSNYTLSSLADLYEKTEKVYTYLALTLGFATTTDLGGDVEIPTPHDFLEVLDAFAAVTANADGSKTYTVDAGAQRKELEAILNWTNSNKEKTLSGLVWDLLGDEISSYYPEVISWNTFMNQIKKSYTGTMLLKDAVNNAVSMLENKNICTLDDIYGIMNVLALMGGEEDFDAAEYVAENWNMTLNELAKEAGYSSLNALYVDVNSYMINTKLGELEMGSRYEYNESTGQGTWVRYTLSEWLEEALEGMDDAAAVGTVVVTLDAQGRLLGVDLNYDVDYTNEDGAVEQISAASMELKRDDTVKVQIPERFQPVSDVKLEAIYDGNGDMIITVPEGFDYTFEVGGYGDVPIADLVEVDEELTAEVGFTVYVLKREHWTRSSQEEEYMLYNGKYYQYNYTQEIISESYQKIVDEVSLAAVLADPNAILPDATDKKMGKATVNGVEVNVYDTVMNPVFQLNGVWYMAKNYYDNGRYSEQDENGEWIYYTIYSINSYVAVSDALANVRISSVYSNTYSAKKDSVEVQVKEAYLSLDTTSWGTETIEVYFYIGTDGSINLVTTEYVYGNSRWYYQLGAEVPRASWPTHDEVREFEYSSSQPVRDASGNEVTGVKWVELYRYMPTYYVKLNRTAYASFSCRQVWDYETDTYKYEFSLPTWIKTSVGTSNKPVVTMPDGNKLYVFGTDENPGQGQKGRYDRTVYGYAKVGEFYVQAVCRYSGNKLLEAFYRSGGIDGTSDYNALAESTRKMEYNDYIDLAQYLTKVNDTTYRVSASFFTKMNALCNKEGDSYWVRVKGAKTVNEIDYDFTAAVGLYQKAETLTNDYHYYYGNYVYWNNYFGYGYDSKIPQFSVIPGHKRDSLTVRLNSGEKITVTYSASNGYPVVDGMIPYNAEKSAEVGLPIYSAVTEYNYVRDRLYDNGKYYRYNTYGVYDGLNYTTLDNISSKIAGDWYFTYMSYRYDFTDQTGAIYPVYEATVSFDVGGTTNVYVAIKDGKLYVLSGARTNGASALVFEDMVAPGTYFTAVSQKFEIDTNGYNDRTILINGNKTVIYYTYARFYDLNAAGETVRTNSIRLLYVIENGVRRYITGYGNWLGTYLEKGSECTIDNKVDHTLSRETYYNGTFVFADVRYASLKHYVKLAGEYYHYGDNYFTSSYYIYSQSGVENALANKDHYYGVYDEATETWSYYNRMEFLWEDGVQYAALSEPMATLPTFTGTPTKTTMSCCTLDGKTVFEFSGYVAGDIEETPCADGTVFCHKEGSQNGFLKIDDDKYLRARMIVNVETGAYRVVCESLSRATLSSNEMRYMNPLGKYFKVDRSGTLLTISKDILKVIPETVRDKFTLSIYSGGNSYYSVTLNYDELVGWFELTEERDCNAGDFNGFVDHPKAS